MFPSTSSRKTLRFSGNKIYCSPRDQSLSVNYYTSNSLWKIWLVESIQSIHSSLWIDIINAISAADIAFSMSSSASAWLLRPLECSPQKQNGWTLRFCFWEWIMWKMYNWIRFSHDIMNYQNLVSMLSASVDNTDLGFDNSWYHAQLDLIQ